MIRSANRNKARKPRRLEFELVRKNKEAVRITAKCGEWTRSRAGRCYCSRCEGWPCAAYKPEEIKKFEDRKVLVRG